MKRLKHHPLASILPSMTDAEYASLRADVFTHGVREPIVLLDGMILDGRHRERAARDAGRKCPTRTFDPVAEGDPIDYLYSAALHRNLTESQRAALSVRFEQELGKLAAERQRASRFGSNARGSVVARGRSRDAAGKAFNVSGRYVGMAKRLHKKSPELFASVLEGHFTLSTAIARISEPRGRRGVRVAIINLATGKTTSRTFKDGSTRQVLAAIKSGGLR